MRSWWSSEPELPVPDDAEEIGRALAEESAGEWQWERLSPREQRKWSRRERDRYVKAWQKVHPATPEGPDA